MDSGQVDQAYVAEVTSLPVDTVSSVFRQCNNDQAKIQAAINQFLDSGSGLFKDVRDGVESGEAWAESGKPRRAKKARRAAQA